MKALGLGVLAGILLATIAVSLVFALMDTSARGSARGGGPAYTEESRDG
jgi:hypothetical protein